MKKVLLLVAFVVGVLSSTSVKAQYCGGASGTNICRPVSNMTTPGFQPPEDSLPCIVDGVAYSQVISVRTPATVTSGGSTYNLSYIKIDTVSNLPCGICWAMGASNFQIPGNSTGCLRISGTSYDAPGQYLLHIVADVTVILGIFPYTVTNQDLASQGLKYYVRAQLPGDSCVHIDTLLTGNKASHAGAITAPTIRGNTSVCTGGTTTLRATDSAYYAYAWSNGTFNDSITVGPGTYTVTVYGSCNHATATATVTVATIRDTIAAAGPTTICQGSTVLLSVPTGSAYHWSNGATTNSINAGASGTYVVTVTNSIGCSAVSSGVSVTVNPAPVDTVSTSGPLAFCPGGSVTLTGPSGLTYQWSNGSTAQSINVTQTATFTLIVTNSNNCSAISSQVIVTRYPSPVNTVTVGGATTFCPGDSVVLSAASNSTYQWSNGATTQTIAAAQAGTYTVTVTNNKGCTAVSSGTTVTLLAAPNDTITASGPLSLCTGGSVALSAAPGLAYSWSTGSNAMSIVASQSGSYTVTVTNSNNCTAVSAPAVVTVNPIPTDTISADGPTTICSGSNVTLSAVSGYNYHWSTGATSQSINVTQAGNYAVTITNGTSCSATSAPVTVNVNARPSNTVTVGGSTTFCSGGSVLLTAAPGLTYLWTNGATTQAISVNQTGSYSVTVTNANSCTATSSPVSVTVLASPTATVTANGPTTFCPGGSVMLTATAGLNYVWSNGSSTQSITVTQAGNYTVTVTNSNQCSALVSAPAVTLYSSTVINTQPSNQVTCVNGQVNFSVSAGGTNLTYQWQKNGVNITGQQSATYNIPSAALSDTGNYRVIITGTCGKDTSNAASLSVAASLTFSQQPLSQTICLGKNVSFTVVANGANTTYQWKKNGQSITNANAATYTINSTAGTDTGSYTCYVTSSCGTATSNPARLTIVLPTSSNISQTICAGRSYFFNGRSLTLAGTYLDTLNNAVGCDSIITLNLTITPPLTYSYSDSICSGNIYNFNGRQLGSAGTYKDTVFTTGGCDSIVTLHLSVKQPASSNTYASICQGATYHFNGLSLTTAGTYQVTLTGSNQCDSTATLHLTLNQPTYSNLFASVCGNRTYNFNGRALSVAGTYTDTIGNSVGCDSIITLNLSVTSSVSYAYTAAICSGGFYAFNGRIVTNPGVYIDTILAAGGCDSIVTLRLIVNQPTGSSITASVCYGAGYTFGGRSLSTSGVYYDTLNNSHGCDSIITLNLTVKPANRTGIHASICNGTTYAFNGQQLNMSGTYIAHYTATDGCDSIVTLVLQVGSYVTNGINTSVCAGSSYTFNGRHLTAAGTYYDTLIARGGCDSIVILHLSITPPSTGSIQAAICLGGSYTFNGRHLTAAGTYTDTLVGSNGCDSILTLTLQVNSFITTNIADTICQGSSYNFNGQSLSTTGVYYDTLTAQGGCDSIVILNLTVNHTTGSTINAAICVGTTYLFNGVQIGATGTYFEALTGSNGCDSIVRLQLVVNSFITTTTAANICYGSTYSFFGRQLSATGTYTDTLSAQGGCDSVIVLNLIVNPIITHNLSVAICAGGGYNFHGQQLSTPGTYRDTLITSGGCDSVVVLHLSTTQVVTGSVSANICNGTSYSFNGQNLTAAGLYTDTLTALGGCDSIVTLNLGVYPSFNFISNQSICSGGSYPFNGHNLAIGGTYYDTLSTRHGCDSILTLNLTVKPAPVITWAQPDTICNNNDSTQITIVAPGPAGGTLTGSGLNGLVLTLHGNGTYPVTYSFVDTNGCSSTVTKNLLVESCLGIENISADPAIFIYPNPAGDVVIAQGVGITDGHIAPVVCDIMGKSVAVSYSRQADKITFNTNGLSAGMYLIKFNINGTVISKHFVKAE